MSLPRLKQQPTKSNTKSNSNARLSMQNTQASKSSGSAKSSSAAISNSETLAREAEILSLLTMLNAPVLNAELPATLQAVKAALYAREYAKAFGQPHYLLAYCARWVPGRALAYRDFFVSSDAFVSLHQRQTLHNLPLNILCIGGGAGSEVLALASIANELSLDSGMKMNVTAVDCADWSLVMQGMSELFRDRWKLDEQDFSLTYRREDTLSAFPSYHLSETNVITLLYTTNELFASSRPKTLAFLSHLTSSCQPGTLLIVAESVGTYSEISVGGKQYPLELVLDQHLAGKERGWKTVEKDPGRWYRVPEESKKRYQLQIENTHMLLRVYEKT